ncbi:hypothetical protein Tco_0960963 [Tanacetum coccineum]
MTTLVELMIIAGVDNRPPMLDKTMYDSWKSRMELYIENGENRRMILNSGLLLDVYVIFNHHKVTKEIWDKVKLLMQCTSLSLQEQECKLYDEFDKFTYIKGETLYQYYWRFAQLINDMHIINMTIRPVQVNTKFLNSLPPKWSKFVTDVKLARDLHTTNYDQLYSYLQQHEAHANETRLLHERYQDPLALLSYAFLQPTINLELPIIREIKPLFKMAESLCNKFKGGKQCTLAKRPRNATWFKEKAMLAEVHESGQILDEDQQAFLADPGITNCYDVQPIISHNAAFQIDDLDAYDSDCNDISSAKAKAQRIKPTLYAGSVISRQHDVILVTDEEETLILEEAPRELPKVSLVNTSLKKLKYHLGKFDTVVKKRITPDAITEGSWGFKHTKVVFINEVIPFLMTLKDIFNVFDKDLLVEITEVQTVFNQMEAAIQHESCNKCLDLEAELVNRKNMVERDDNSCKNQNALEFSEYFENNDLKAQLQEKDTTINKLRNHIKSLRESDKKDKVKQDMNDIETINIELEHSVAKLLSKNELLPKEIEHLKKIYKDQFDSIKMTQALSKEHYDSLIAQLNSKSMENADLKGQIQEKVFGTTTLQNELRRLKGMFKLDLDPLAPRLLKNSDVSIDYLRYTQEQADILWGIVKQAKAKQPLDDVLDFSYKHAK